jgi:hypothetical protein
MTRGAWLLLLLSSWLLALPALRLSGPCRQASIVASDCRDVSVAAGEHLVSQTAAVTVPRAPLQARLPVPHAFEVVGHAAQAWPLPTELGDRRDALRRVQLRRRLPRLGGDDPPWS